MEQSSLQQIVERLKQVNTVLVTVNKNPTLDQLAACIGLTLFINKMDKHAAAVFSGVVPSTLEFLEPSKTLEQNTDSLRDFIISLDKEKADKLRYKVEDDVVKIFITPYRTSLNREDFDFSQGDFNVEAVIALGVTNRDELDNAITAHGRILHDATVIGVSVGQVQSELGAMNWHEPGASSLSELAARLCAQLDPHGFDGQIATALMTGIVSETDRFRNNKTNPQVMQMSAQLMAAGANQQLIADKLEEPIAEVTDVPAFDDQKPQEDNAKIGENDDIVVNEDGSLAIKHDKQLEKTPTDAASMTELPEAPLVSEEPEAEKEQTLPEEPVAPEIAEPAPAEPEVPEAAPEEEVTRERMDEAPPSEGKLTSSTVPEHEIMEPSTDGLLIKPAVETPIMGGGSHGKKLEPFSTADELRAGADSPMPEQPAAVSEPPLVLPEPVADHESKPQDTLAQIEQLIGSTHAAVAEHVPLPDEGSARDEANKLAESSSPIPPPPMALNALPALENLNTIIPAEPLEQQKVEDPNAPPPVPPPMSPQFFDNSGAVHNPYK